MNKNILASYRKGYILHLILICLINSSIIYSQSFEPAAGQPGSSAIHKDSSIIAGWANWAVIERGFLDIAQPGDGYVSFGDPLYALFEAEGTATECVSLGDGGKATLTFPARIKNGPGPDFAVFENSLWDDFLELAFVEVSSDGEHFVRFPAISEIQTDTQIDGFGSTDCRYIHNFAGKYRAAFGTPFDLEDLTDSLNIDLNSITHIRLVDVIGSIDPNYATYDAYGTIVNNNYPTSFESGGFDLDAVGIIHFADLGIDEIDSAISIYPNPVDDVLHISGIKNASLELVNLKGELILSQKSVGTNSMDLSTVESGVYLLKIQLDEYELVKKVVVK